MKINDEEIPFVCLSAAKSKEEHIKSEYSSCSQLHVDENRIFICLKHTSKVILGFVGIVNDR